MIWQLLVCSGSIATNGKILAKGGKNSTTDELCRNVDKVQMLILNTVSPPFANILLAAVFRQAIT
jgi:hypothetical protein